jgi:predicted ATPase/DNA-binding CsgD family transcriptional regulator
MEYMNEIPNQTWIEALHPREIEILRLISDGLSNREISQRLHISLETVKWYNKLMFAKLGVKSRTQAVKVASLQGWLAPQAAAQAREEKPAPGNLPAQITSFIGRVEEVSEIKALLKASRLVVLTGVGGTGKTRLALQVAGELARSYRDGAWLVELAPISDPALVPDAIADALKVTPIGEASSVDALNRFLARKRLLLLVDNFEHLPSAMPLVGKLLAAAPGLVILATSRERLHVYGEQEYLVSPLSLPDPRHSEPIAKLLSYEAIDLFVQRARSAQPRLEVNEKNMQAILQICVHLDGLPLALELAASQVKIYPPAALAQQLGKSLGSLPEGPRDLPARQRTLRAAIEWSENLLDPEEKILFTRLAVFSAGAALDAIERVCGAGLTRDNEKLMSGLVEKNLVILREGQDGELRFMMLETIHDYVRQQLAASGEEQEIRRLHAACYADLASLAYREFRTARNPYWFAKLSAEQENLRAALDWSLGEGDQEYALRMVASLRDHWMYNGKAMEGRHWSGLVLEKAVDAPAGMLAGVLCTAGILAYNSGDLQLGEQLLRRSLALFRQSGDKSGAAWTLTFLSVSGVGSPGVIDVYIDMVQQSLEMFRRLGDQPGMAQAYNIFGELTRSIGEYDKAQQSYEECLRIVQVTGERFREAMLYTNLGYIANHREQYRHAVDLIRRGLSIFRELEGSYGLALNLASLAGPLNELGFHEKAARLLGAAEAEMKALGINQQPADQIEIKGYLSSIRQGLGEAAFETAWQEGQKLSIREAVEYALRDE